MTIFDRDSGTREESLDVNDNGAPTYNASNSGWRMARRGSEATRGTLTPDEAKKRWPQYADRIDAAIAEIAAQKKRPPE